MAAPEFSKLRLRLRPDLVISPPAVGGRRSWVVKDPVALRYFTFGAEEYSILAALDGTLRLDELRERFERMFAPQRMTSTRLAQFLASAYLNGLLVSDGPEQAAALLEARSRERRSDRWRRWTNLLAIRFRGFDPERLLGWLYPKMRWCFSPPAVWGGVALVVLAAALLATEAAEFRAQLPTLAEFVSARNVLWLAVTLAATKVLHELGHALTCRHFGGECHEMGVMLLVLTPCLYCNVTDAWMLRSRWQRIATSAAGMAVELVLASLAVYGWWWTQPGLVHTLCVNTILVCGIGTLVFNGNPLLRYDGYFILSDLVGVPNLWQESRRVLRQRLAGWFLRGDDASLPAGDERRGLLIAYGLASIAYQVLVVAGVLLFLYRSLAAAGLDALAYLLLAGMSAGLIGSSATGVWRGVSNPSLRKRARMGRLAVGLLLVMAAVVVLLFVPLRSRLIAPALVQVEGAQRVYVTTPGTLRSAAVEGDRVAAGQVIARLDDAETNQRIAELTGQRDRLAARVRHLEARAAIDADAAAEQVIAREMLADAAERLGQQQREQQALTLTAPIGGMVIAPPPMERGSAKETGRLPAWLGTPLEPRNAGCYLQRGTLFCTVGNPERMEAVVFVDESDIEQVRVGQRVRLWFDVGSSEAVDGTVAEIAEGDMKFVPPELAAVKELASRADAEGHRRVLETAYQLRIRLAERPAALVSGARGRAKIAVEPQTLGARLYRAVRRLLTVKS